MSALTLYIIHGWTYTIEPWRETVAMLKKNGISVKMLKVPGLTEPSKKVWTIEDYVKWADKNIPDGAVALGHSNGGRILLNLCAQKPEKLQSLILLNAAGVYEKSRKREVSKKLSKVLAPVKKIPGAKKVVHKLLGAQDYDKAPENMKKTLANMIDSDKNLEIAKVTTPTYLLWGEVDKTTPLRQAQVLRRTLPNATLKTFPKWAHAPYITHPAELAHAIEAVVAKIIREEKR